MKTFNAEPVQCYGCFRIYAATDANENDTVCPHCKGNDRAWRDWMKREVQWIDTATMLAEDWAAKLTKGNDPRPFRDQLRAGTLEVPEGLERADAFGALFALDE